MPVLVRSTARLAIALLALCIVPALALAQDKGEAKPKPPRRTPLAEVKLEELLLEEITVTARKKEEGMLKAPVSMTAMGAAQLRDLSITDLGGITGFTPNLLFGQAASDSDSARIYIRGSGQDDTIATQDPGVAVYVDGVYLGRGTGSNIALTDVERVEVLRGPQGTLFGKNTVGGAINVITKQPTSDFYSELRASIGNYGRLDTGVVMNVPIFEETLAMRFGIESKYNRGFYKNEWDDSFLDNDRRLSFRGKVRYTPTTAWDSTLAFERVYAREHAQPTEPARTRTCSIQNPGSFSRALCNATNLIYGANPAFVVDGDPRSGFHNFGAPGISTFPGGEPNYQAFARAADANQDDLDIWGSALTLDHEVSPYLRFKSISAWRRMRTANGSDGDGTAVPMLATYIAFNHHQVSQELQLLGHALDDRLDWVGGLYAFRESSDTDSDSATLPLMAIAPFNVLNASRLSELDAEGLSYAGFLNGDYALTDSLTANAGIRYTYERKRFERDDRGHFPGGIPGLGATVAPTAVVDAAGKDRWGGWAFRFGLTQDVGEHGMVYGSFSRGLRSGGFNGRAGNNARQLQPYDQEVVKTLEVGAKGSFFGHRLSVRTAAFYNRYSDMQLTIFTVNPVTGLFLSLVENAARADIFGLETEFEAIPAPGWMLAGGIGLTEAEYEQFYLEDPESCPPAPCTILNRTDLELKNTPVLTFNVRLDRTFQLGRDRGTLVTGLDYAWRGDVYHNVANSDFIKQNGYGLLGARMTWRSPAEKYEVALWAKNLLDREYLNHGLDFTDTIGVALGYYGDPRTFGVDLTYRFE